MEDTRAKRYEFQLLLEGEGFSSKLARMLTEEFFLREKQHDLEALMAAMQAREAERRGRLN